MNERIKQLRQKARDSAERWVLRREEKGQYPTATEMQSKWDEKFAELIVKECVDLLETSLPYNPQQKMIKKHFGVKE